MDHFEFLPKIVVLLAAAVFIVAVFKRLNLSPVLGYLVAGAAIGQNGLGYIDSENLKIIAEFGIVFLLFAIGLELTLERLIAMRAQVFGFGTAQFLITTCLIAAICYFLGLSKEQSIIIGGALSLSSTAIVLRILAEKNIQRSQVGRLALSNLLLQDFAVVPLLVLVPLLADNSGSIMLTVSGALIKTAIALIAIFFFGRMLLRPLFGLIASTNSNELFVAATLFVVLGTSFATHYFGLSLAMGAFIAGLLVAETQYQHKVEESITLFKGLLMGLFFMTVGMGFDLLTIYERLPIIVMISIGLIISKTLIILTLARIFKFSFGNALHAGLLLSQGSEFAFILFSLAAGEQYSLISEYTAQTLLLVVTVTMALTPALSSLGYFISKKVSKNKHHPENDFSDINDLNKHVVIAGFGETGSMVSKLLSSRNINYIIVEGDTQKVKEARELDLPIYHGDISKPSTLEHVALNRAKAIVIAISDNVYLKKSIRIIRKKHADIPIIVKARNLRNYRMLKKIGATVIIPEKFETGLHLGGTLLNIIGMTNIEVSQAKINLRDNNYGIT